jgi:hypothetical protein
VGTFLERRVLRARSSTTARGRGGALPAAILVLPILAVQAATSTPAGASETWAEEAPLTTAVTASGTVARTYSWSIEKSADAAVRSTDSTGRATFLYTVSAKAGAASDAGWALTGTVTVTNPNGWAVVADVDAATTLGGGSSCTVTGGDDVVVPPSGSTPGEVVLPYACSFTSAPASSGTVTATATWDPAGEATTASAGSSAPASFAVTSETDRTVAVVDDKTVPGQRVVLDPSVTWAPGLVRTYTYDLALLGGAPGACASYANTAAVDRASGTDPSAVVTVQACTPEVLPAQAFGRAVGGVHATCRGTVRTRMSNRTDGPVAYKLRIGNRVHRIVVKSLRQKKFVTSGPARAMVTLKVGSTRLDRARIPQRCEVPELLPSTGLRAGSR